MGECPAKNALRFLSRLTSHLSQLIAFFEICAHPLHSTPRVRSSMGMLDALLRSMGLLAIDAEDPRASIFTTGVPAVTNALARPLRHRQLAVQDFPAQASPQEQQLPPTEDQHLFAVQQWQPEPPLTDPTGQPPTQRPTPLYVHPQGSDFPPLHDSQPSVDARLPRRPVHAHPEQLEQASDAPCTCMTFTLGHTWPMVREFAPLWDMTPTWQSEWTESEIRKEECRRLVWSSVVLTAGHSSYTAASSAMEVQQLFLMDPRNVSSPPSLLVAAAASSSPT